MKILHLNLKKQWFDLIHSGVKKEEYRESKPWIDTRLINESNEYKEYDIIRFRNGYSKNAPSMDVEFKGVIFDQGVADWGAVPGEVYHCIQLGNILNSENVSHVRKNLDMKNEESKTEQPCAIQNVSGSTFYEYGAMSSKYRIEATNKLTAYATMVYHFGNSNHLVTIYSPEESRKDIWLNPMGQVAERLDEIFGGENAFDKYVEENIEDIKKCMDTIEQLV